MTKKKTEKRKIKIADKRHDRSESSTAKQEQPTRRETAEQKLQEKLRQFTSGAVDSVVVTPPQPKPDNGQAKLSVEDPLTLEIDWESQAAENLELAQRKQAEMENFRKRAIQDKADARRNAVEALLYDLFPVLDGLNQAIHTFKDRAQGEDPLLDGVRSSIKVLDSAFCNHGIERISEIGVAFDANLHQPLAVEESNEVDVETVAEIYTVGYRMGERVLKAAMVKVVKPVGDGN